VGAAAGRQVEPFDVDQSQRSAARRFLAQRQRRGFFGRHEADRHRTVFPHHAVGFGFGGGELGRRQLAFQVDGGRVRAQVEAQRPRAAHAQNRRGQHVLSGVLLHVIEAAGPIDLAVDVLAWCQTRLLDDVSDPAVFLIEHIDDPQAAQCPGVERLTAGGGIEGRPVERDRPAVAARFDLLDGGVKRS